MKIKPSSVVLKKGEACEFEITINPICSCKVNDEIVLFCSNGSKSSSYDFYIPIIFETEESKRIDYDEIVEEKIISEGKNEIISEGMFRGNKVRIKQLPFSNQIELDETLFQKFENEIKILENLSNDYIVHFYGACCLKKHTSIVMELNDKGTLNDIIFQKHNDLVLSDTKKIKCCLDTAKAIQYIHSKNIMHRDIKTDNLLVVTTDENTINVKLSDFSSSRFFYPNNKKYSYTTIVGTPIYSAPEILKEEKYNQNVDIYSLAITMLEIMIWNNVFPTNEFKFTWDIVDYISSGKRPTTIEQVNLQPIKKLIESCWCENPNERLPIDDIVLTLEKELKKKRLKDSMLKSMN